MEELFAASWGSPLFELFPFPRFFFPLSYILMNGYPRDKPGPTSQTRGAPGLARVCLAYCVLMLSFEASLSLCFDSAASFGCQAW